MLNLQPLIARFVDDILRLIREAAAEDLRSLVARDARRSRQPHPVKHSAAIRHRRIVDDPGQRSRGLTAAADLSPPPTVAEITDPEALLAGTAPEPAGARADARAEGRLESESHGPASTVRPMQGDSPVRLMGNETLARVSNAGIVIRRARRA